MHLTGHKFIKSDKIKMVTITLFSVTHDNANRLTDPKTYRILVSRYNNYCELKKKLKKINCQLADILIIGRDIKI